MYFLLTKTNQSNKPNKWTWVKKKKHDLLSGDNYVAGVLFISKNILAVHSCEHHWTIISNVATEHLSRGVLMSVGVRKQQVVGVTSSVESPGTMWESGTNWFYKRLSEGEIKNVNRENNKETILRAITLI